MDRVSLATDSTAVLPLSLPGATSLFSPGPCHTRNDPKAIPANDSKFSKSHHGSPSWYENRLRTRIATASYANDGARPPHIISMSFTFNKPPHCEKTLFLTKPPIAFCSRFCLEVDERFSVVKVELSQPIFLSDVQPIRSADLMDHSQLLKTTRR